LKVFILNEKQPASWRKDASMYSKNRTADRSVAHLKVKESEGPT
jgi:hypothetical protein